MSDGIVLSGIDGANPLGFLAAMGTLSIFAAQRPQAKLTWRMEEGKWRPVMFGTYLQKLADEERETAFVRELRSLLLETSDRPFEIERKLPFSKEIFAQA